MLILLTWFILGTARNALGIVATRENTIVWIFLPPSRDITIKLGTETHSSKDFSTFIFRITLKQFEVKSPSYAPFFIYSA